jgi:peroxiredoxin
MVELGQLEKHYGEFDARGVRVVAVSLDNVEESKLTQEKFPHLTILSDHDQSLARAADVLAPSRRRPCSWIKPAGYDGCSARTVTRPVSPRRI